MLGHLTKYLVGHLKVGHVKKPSITTEEFKDDKFQMTDIVLCSKMVKLIPMPFNLFFHLPSSGW